MTPTAARCEHLPSQCMRSLAAGKDLDSLRRIGSRFHPSHPIPSHLAICRSLLSDFGRTYCIPRVLCSHPTPPSTTHPHPHTHAHPSHPQGPRQDASSMFHPEGGPAGAKPSARLASCCTPPLPPAGVSTRTERGRQHSDSHWRRSTASRSTRAAPATARTPSGTTCATAG